MVCLALTRTKWAVLIFSWTAGVMYSTLFTMPYLLVAHYHETDTIHCEDTWFLRQIRSLLASIKANQATKDGEAGAEKGEEGIEDLISGQVRGIGTDVAIVSAMVFLAQFILSSLMGSIVQLIGDKYEYTAHLGDFFLQEGKAQIVRLHILSFRLYSSSRDLCFSAEFLWGNLS